MNAELIRSMAEEEIRRREVEIRKEFETEYEKECEKLERIKNRIVQLADECVLKIKGLFSLPLKTNGTSMEVDSVVDVTSQPVVEQQSECSRSNTPVQSPSKTGEEVVDVESRREQANGRAMLEMGSSRQVLKRRSSGNYDDATKMKNTTALVCYKCGGQGHFRRDCVSQGKLCYNCNGFGHKSAMCELPATRASKAARSKTISRVSVPPY